jgi:hypothetical protein
MLMQLLSLSRRFIRSARSVGALAMGVGLLAASAWAQPVVLNEVQTSNASTLTDDAGGSPDWIELLNTGASLVDLAGYGLSDDPANPFKWTFANAEIAPGQYLLVYASGRDRQPGMFPGVGPGTVPGLKVWLLAEAVNAADPTQVRSSGDDLFVLNWQDQSGGGWDAQEATEAAQPRYLAASPEFGGRPVLRFDGVDDVLRLPAVTAANNFCVVAVFRADVGHEIDTASSGGVGGVSGQRYLLGATHGGDYGAGAGLSVGTNGASVYEHGSGYMPALAVGTGVGAGVSVVAMNYSNRQPTLWIRGNLAAVGFTSSRTNVTSPTEIGAGSYGAFSGDLAEILFFDRALTDPEVAGLQEYFAAKYGIEFPRYYHTNFKLDRDGEPLTLTRPDGVVADSFPPLYIPTDVSWGRQPDGVGEGVYFEHPTPGAANLTPGSKELLGAPALDVPAGFYTNAVTVGLTSTNSGAEIRYTMDGSYPTTSSPLYKTPLRFESRRGTPNDISMVPTAGGWQPPLGEVFKMNVLRARAFRTNALPSAITTASYCIDPRGRARYTLPVVSLTTDRANFFDPNIGIYVCGNAPGCNYAQAGDAWERPVHVEFFETNGVRALAQESGVRMHGNTSFGFPIKALRLHPLNQLGGQPFRYRIFPDLPITEFSRLLLRPSGHDHYLTMMRDGFMQNAVRELDIDLQSYRPAILFLNGEYWGVHNLQEAYEENYFANHHPGVDPQVVDYLEGYAPGAFVYAGDGTHFDDLILFMQSHSLSSASNYAWVQTQMEVENYRDFKIAETFYYRWDIGNQRVWRPHTPDGRLRWILFDCDVGFGGFWSQPAGAPWTFNMLAYNLEPNGPWLNYQPGNDHNAPLITLQLRALMANADFKRDFINRTADLMNSTLSAPRLTWLIDRMAAEISPEMGEHCARWRAPADWPGWTNNIAWLEAFATNRAEYMRRQMTNQFGLRGWANVTLSVSDTNAGSIRFNTLDACAPTNAPWIGVYFRDNPLTFSAQPQPGYRFVSWRGLAGPPSTSRSNTLTLNGSLTLTANFEATPATNPPVPIPFPLGAGPYVFSGWDGSAQAGTFPPSMIFLQTATNAIVDPGLGAEMTNSWLLPYNRTSRSRMIGLGEDGLGLLNTSDPQTDQGGYIGAVVLAVNTIGVTNAQVVWRGGTVVAGSRRYALRLQYRLGASGPYADVQDRLGQPVEYVGSSTGHSVLIGPLALPTGAVQQPYVQLRWKYYWRDGFDGPRDELRLDDIVVVAGAVPPPRIGSVSLLQSGWMLLKAATSAPLIYTVETSTNLAGWTAWSSVLADPQGRVEVLLPPSPWDSSRFYRLRWP